MPKSRASTFIRSSCLTLPICAALASCGSREPAPSLAPSNPPVTSVTKTVTPAPKAEGGIKETRAKRRKQLASQPNG